MTEIAFATYHHDSQDRPAVVVNGELFDLREISRKIDALGDLQGVTASVDDVIAHWEQVAGRVPALKAQLAQAISAGDIVPVKGGQALLSLPFRPFRIFGAASNFVEHADEMETKLKDKAESTPFIFMKSQASAIGPNESVVIPVETKKPDWEVELGVVIGRPGRRIPVEKAIDHIAGYVVVNDVSARDLTRRTDFPFSHDWFRGKSFDTFTPMGPWFVPACCISDPHDLRLTLDVNGERMQDGNTGEMIFNAFEQIAYLSTLLTLQPGDVIATGTPAGVGMGRGVFLKPGDVMTAAIEGVGEITNPVVAEDVSRTEEELAS